VKQKQVSVKLAQAISTDIYCDKLEEISDLKIFSECFRGPLKMLWWATFGPRDTICPPLNQTIGWQMTVEKIASNIQYLLYALIFTFSVFCTHGFLIQ